MDFNLYQTISERTLPIGKTNNELLTNFALGLTGESGECADYIKKVVFHGHNLDLFKIESELGDVLWYVSAIATTLGINLEDVAYSNFEKLSKRYIEGFSEEASKARVDVNE